MNILYTLFPKGRAEIIRLLFADASQELHLRDLARSSGLALRTLQTEVRKLEKAELLRSRRDGNRLYFKANTDLPIFPELHSIALKTTGLVDRVKTALESIEGIELAFIFGSFAGVGETAGSDVDLFIIGSAGLRKILPCLRPLALELGREINPYVTSRSGFAKKAKANDAFIANVIESPKLWIQGGADELTAMAS